MRNTMRMTEILAEMIDSLGSRRAFAEKIGLPPTTLQSMLTRDLSRASVTNVIDVCRGLGITIEELESLASNEKFEPETIAAHHDNDDWTEEELQDIEEFKELLKLKRQLKMNKE